MTKTPLFLLLLPFLCVGTGKYFLCVGTGKYFLCVGTGKYFLCVGTGKYFLCVGTGKYFLCVGTGKYFLCVGTGKYFQSPVYCKDTRLAASFVCVNMKTKSKYAILVMCSSFTS